LLSLILRGKQSVTEDALTACVFDRLSETRDVEFLMEFLAGSTALDNTGLVPPVFDDFELELWPWTAAGEPDVRIRLYRKSKDAGRIIVEAKLGAGKSNGGDETQYGQDQLGRYLLAEDARERAPFLALTYLTHHGACPRADLQESARHLAGLGRADLGAKLYWRSWRDVELMSRSRPSAWSRVAEILARASMCRFSGAWPQVPRVSATDRFSWTNPRMRRSVEATYGWTLPPPGLDRWVPLTRQYAWPVLTSTLPPLVRGEIVGEIRHERQSEALAG
jgi:hypothetical protein